MHPGEKRVWVSSLMGRRAPARWPITYIEHFFWACVSLWPIISLLSQHLTCLRSLLGMHAHLLAKKDSSTEAYGKVDNIPYGLAPFPLTPKETFCACVVKEVSLTWRMRNMWFLYVLFKQDSALPHSCHHLYLGVSVHRGQFSAA